MSVSLLLLSHCSKKFKTAEQTLSWECSGLYYSVAMQITALLIYFSFCLTQLISITTCFFLFPITLEALIGPDLFSSARIYTFLSPSLQFSSSQTHLLFFQTHSSTLHKQISHLHLIFQPDH